MLIDLQDLANLVTVSDHCHDYNNVNSKFNLGSPALGYSAILFCIAHWSLCHFWILTEVTVQLDSE